MAKCLHVLCYSKQKPRFYQYTLNCCDCVQPSHRLQYDPCLFFNLVIMASRNALSPPRDIDSISIRTLIG